MSVKTAGVGKFMIPTAPAAGVSCTSGAANVFTTTYVQLIASTAAALYITGLYIQHAATAATYLVTQLATGGAGSETIISQILTSNFDTATAIASYTPIFPPIPVATATRIAVKTADSVGGVASLVTLECIAQSNVVDDGIAVGTVTTVTNQLTAAAIATGVWQDAVAGDFTVASSIGKALQITNIVPGAAGGHMISGSNAGTTTFGALTVTGVTTLTGNAVLSDGLTISAPSTLNRAGLDIAGNGTGAAIKAVAGGTGVGFSIAGGGTSGDGVKVTTTSGHGMNLAPVGTSMHGLFVTGGNGGTSDGFKAVAGTGGTDIRATNITGTLSTVTTLTNLPSIPANWITAAGINAAALNGKGDWATVNPTNLTAAQIATGVWQDTTAGDFTTALSVGKSVMNGVTLGTGLTVNAVTGLTASNLDTTVSSRMATYTQPTGFLAATFPSGTVANTTNITAGTITTTTNLTNLPSIPNNWLTAAGIAAAALNGKGDWNIGKTGYSLTTADWFKVGDYTAPDNTSVAAIKVQTDKLAFSVANQVNANITYVNAVKVNGLGTQAVPWGP